MSQKRSHSEVQRKTKRTCRQNTRSALDLVHPHPRDQYVYFDEAPHVYEIYGDSTGVTSVTTFVHCGFPHFDGEKVSTTMLNREKWLDNPKYRFLLPIVSDYLLHKVPTEPREIQLYQFWLVSLTAIPGTDLYSHPLFEPGSGRPRDVLRKALFEPGSPTLLPEGVPFYLRWRINRNAWTETPLFGELKTAVLGSWEANRLDAATRGTAMHANIEHYYNDEPHETESKEWQLFQKFLADRPYLKPWRTEMVVWCKALLLAGSVDMIYLDTRTGKYKVYDWKRSREIKMEGFCSCWGRDHSSENCDGYGNTDLTSDLGNCNFIHYSLQLHTYTALLERHYKLEIDGCFIVVLHPDQRQYIELEAAPLKNRVKLMMGQRQAEVKIARMRELELNPIEEEPSAQTMINWSVEPSATQVKGRRFHSDSGDLPTLQLSEESGHHRAYHQHPDYTVLLHLSNPNHNFYMQLPPLIWPANTGTLELDFKIPPFDRPYKKASTPYTLQARLFELESDATKMYRVMEITSGEFIIATHVGKTSSQ